MATKPTIWLERIVRGVRDVMSIAHDGTLPLLLLPTSAPSDALEGQQEGKLRRGEPSLVVAFDEEEDDDLESFENRIRDLEEQVAVLFEDAASETNIYSLLGRASGVQ